MRQGGRDTRARETASDKALGSVLETGERLLSGGSKFTRPKWVGASGLPKGHKDRPQSSVVDMWPATPACLGSNPSPSLSGDLEQVSQLPELPFLLYRRGMTFIPTSKDRSTSSCSFPLKGQSGGEGHSSRNDTISQFYL